MNPQERRSLSPILKRLETNIFSSQEDKRVLKIESLVEKFRQQNYSDRTSLYQHFRYAYNQSLERPETKEAFADTLTAFLFWKNRERFEHLDSEKEKRQIKAVVALLSGKHVQMGTGEGKTSVVFPITNIVEAITSSKQTSTMVTTDESLLSELRSNIDFFANTLNRSLPNFKLHIQPMKDEDEPETLTEDLKLQMAREALLEGNYSEKTKETIRDNYWKDQVKADRFEEKTPKKPTLFLATDRDIVFKYEEGPESFRQSTGNIYFDEADVPYNRRSPYVKVNENQFYLPQEFSDSAIDWLKRYIISRQVSPNNYVLESGGFTLSVSSQLRLNKLDIKDHLRKFRFGEKSDDEIVNAFQQGIQLIGKKLGLDIKDQKRLAARLVNDPFAFGEASTDNSQIGEELAKLHKKKGLLYSFGENGPQVRDSYIDQFLTDHKFSRDEQANILALEGEFDFVPLNPVAYKTTTFQTFVNHLKEKLRFASGTLMFPDPESKKIKSSTFASFLKDATGSKIEIITTPEIKTVPEPKIFSTENETINQLVASIDSKNPTLIVSYQIENSKKIYEELVQKFGADQVAYIPSKPSDPKELIDYQELVKKIYKDLADEKIKIAVSSGAAGFGVNIVRSDGTFPDLKIVLHDLPANRAQLMQILGRRRAPGDNSSWFISEEFLDPYIMLFDDKVGSMSHILGKLDQIEVKNKLKNAKDDPKAIKKLILEIIKESEQKDKEGDDAAILLDELVEKISTKMTHDMEKKTDKEKDVNTAFFYKFFMGLPETLKHFIVQRSGLITKEARITDTRMFFLELNGLLKSDGALESFATSWYQHRDEVLSEFLTIVNHNGQKYYHQPIPSDSYMYFFEDRKDQTKNDTFWGFAKIYSGKSKLSDVLAYRKDGQVYILFDERGNFLTVPSSNQLKTLLDRQTSTKSFNIFNQRYSFLTN